MTLVSDCGSCSSPTSSSFVWAGGGVEFWSVCEAQPEKSTTEEKIISLPSRINLEIFGFCLSPLIELLGSKWSFLLRFSLRRLSLAFGSIEVCVVKGGDGLAHMTDPTSVWVGIPKIRVILDSYTDTHGSSKFLYDERCLGVVARRGGPKGACIPRRHFFWQMGVMPLKCLEYCMQSGLGSLAMLDSMLQFWLIFGSILVFGELILPGLVSVFVGLGALSVAVLLYLNWIDSIPAQLAAWFVSSTIYIFTIRILVVRFYPSDTEKQNIDEDQAMMGRTVDVIESISSARPGRVRFGESTWTAILKSEGEIRVGEKAVVVGRDNISWIVKKIGNNEEI